MSGALLVGRAGAFTSLQDLGRSGAQALGVPVSGALDPEALRTANLLVGNPPGEAALEIRYFGPELTVEAESVRVALAGTGCDLRVRNAGPGAGQRAVPAHQSATLPRGAVLDVGALGDSATACLAVAGGFAVAPVLGSRSTYATAGIGGFAGRALQDGDRLPLAAAAAPEAPDLYLPQSDLPPPDAPIRVVLGPQEDYFSRAGLGTFLGAPYTVMPQSNRMAMRLDGPAIAHGKGFNIPSDGIVTGAIQVPGEGRPIVLLADRQTTGGYPKIACVISADLPRLARVKPGARLRFAAVSVAEAEAIRRTRERRLRASWETIAPAITEDGLYLHRLRSENLISGVAQDPE